MNKTYLSTIVLCFWTLLSLSAQDLSFTQFYAVPYQINPSLTGTIDGSYRVGTIYRDQWRGGVDNPYATTAVGGEVKFDVKPSDARNPDKAGIGLFFLSDKVKAIGLNTSQLSFTGAYHKLLDKDSKQYLGIGGQLSIFQRNINYDQLNFGDEFNELNGYDQATQESLPPNNLGFVDLSVGLNYHANISDKSAFFLGAALHHLTTPNVSFFNLKDNLNPAIDPEISLKLRTVVHANYSREIGESVYVQPSLLYQQQGNDKEIRIGTNMKYFLTGNLNAFHFGLWASAVDNIDGFGLQALSPLVGFQMKNFLLGLSYDINLNQTFSGTRGLNAFELSIRFNGEYYNDGGFCPEF